MCSTSVSKPDPEFIRAINLHATQAKQILQAGPLCVVEQVTDERVYKKLFRSNVKFYASKGKGNGVALLDHLQSSNFEPELLGIFDRDFQLGPVPSCPTYFLTDLYDIEMHGLVASPPESLLESLCEASPTDFNECTWACGWHEACDKICLIGAGFGRLRKAIFEWVDVPKPSLQNLEPKNFISTEDLVIDRANLLNELETIRPELANHTDFLSSEIDQAFDPSSIEISIVRGHDVAKLFHFLIMHKQRSVRLMTSRSAKDRVTLKQIERSMRLPLTPLVLTQTNLVSSIRESDFKDLLK